MFGYGRISTSNIPRYLNNPDMEIYAAIDKKKRCANKLAKEWGAEAVYTYL